MRRGFASGCVKSCCKDREEVSEEPSAGDSRRVLAAPDLVSRTLWVGSAREAGEGRSPAPLLPPLPSPPGSPRGAHPGPGSGPSCEIACLSDSSRGTIKVNCPEKLLFRSRDEAQAARFNGDLWLGEGHGQQTARRSNRNNDYSGQGRWSGDAGPAVPLGARVFIRTHGGCASCSMLRGPGRKLHGGQSLGPAEEVDAAAAVTHTPGCHRVTQGPRAAHLWLKVARSLSGLLSHLSLLWPSPLEAKGRNDF
ncbi:uncharacterized protein LOC104862473 [Fukomys damarensis]|uniref:uncharacterized protein LOC104862473 n=1 Tax=Fukomys damarensis TaxID=885580 RepID=UPI00053FD5A4|nr:uncharacterized protein LOC104862473 [Fukomys damarensis]